MCGICGITLAGQGDVSRDLGARMLRLLAHRGPDSRGVLYAAQSGVTLGGRAEDASEVEAALFHTRLSILDLTEAGRQPMGTPDGRYYLSFNGEIYNYLELRTRLEQEGCGPFRSGSDTEVLLAGFAHWGKEVLNHLNGMFAFAVLDARERTLFLARDFAGIKPLYYTFWKEGFAFSSELAPLLELPGVSRRGNLNRVYDYLYHGVSDHGEDTFFADVKQIPAGHSLAVPLSDPFRPRLERFWRLMPEQRRDLSFEAAAAQTRALFLDSVRLHMRSDVPVGAALSGGIDSSAIVCGIRHLFPDAEIHAFSFIAPDPALSEEPWVDLAAAHAGATAHKVSPEPEEMVRDLDALIRIQGEPFVSTSIYAQYRVFQLARASGIKVMLDGQGADELLGGYKLHMAARLATLIRTGAWAEALHYLTCAGRLSMSGGAFRQVAYALGMLVPEGIQQPALRLLGRSPDPSWLDARWFDQRGVSRQPHLWKAHEPRVLKEMLARSFSQTSLPMLLRYEDRNSMAHSIESRVPFLTTGLVEFLSSLPESYLIDRNAVTKAVFRRAMRGIVPDAILDRRDKIGFVTPQRQWLGKMSAWVAQTLRSDAVDEIPFLNWEVIRQHWRRTLEGETATDSRVVWRWVNLLRWVEQYEVSLKG